ncbi:MAG: poly(A) polymerase [Proteobacteria bacterium]|nr:poly(A) polymerase [Pseudomonadota bacterium]
MIRKFISRVFGHKSPSSAGEPAIIGVARHGIRREAISSGSRRTVETLQQQGYKAYVVGGAVRDLLAGMTPKDYDVATNATPEQVRQCFRRSRIIGRRFQIVHVSMGAETIEVTTFRGHHGEAGSQASSKAQTDEQGRVLRDNVFGSEQDDAARRDFTVNALYFDPTSETIVDYHHGLADLKQKTLRMIGDPKTRYREDPVRMLRAVRLAAKLGLTIDPDASRPIREMSELIENVPPSRLFDEMLKLLTSGYAVKCVQQLRAEGLHRGLLPLLDVILEEEIGKRFVTLALESTDRRVREGKPISPGFLFATLLWSQVLSKWEAIKAGGERPTPALFLAMDEVLEVQAEKLAITRRVAGDIKDIWALQPRFEQRSGKRPYGVLEQPRFKAAYDFLLLRAESGEVDAELGQWWTDFMNRDGEARAAMLLPPKPDEAKKRRRRKRKPAAGATQ